MQTRKVETQANVFVGIAVAFAAHGRALVRSIPLELRSNVWKCNTLGCGWSLGSLCRGWGYSIHYVLNSKRRRVLQRGLHTHKALLVDWQHVDADWLSR